MEIRGIRVPESLAEKPMPEWVTDLLNEYDVEEMSWENAYKKYVYSRNLVDFDKACKNQ